MDSVAGKTHSLEHLQHHGLLRFALAVRLRAGTYRHGKERRVSSAASRLLTSLDGNHVYNHGLQSADGVRAHGELRPKSLPWPATGGLLGPQNYFPMARPLTRLPQVRSASLACGSKMWLRAPCWTSPIRAVSANECHHQPATLYRCGTDFLPQYIDPNVSGNKAVCRRSKRTNYRTGVLDQTISMNIEDNGCRRLFASGSRTVCFWTWRTHVQRSMALLAFDPLVFVTTTRRN